MSHWYVIYISHETHHPLLFLGSLPRRLYPRTILFVPPSLSNHSLSPALQCLQRRLRRKTVAAAGRWGGAATTKALRPQGVVAASTKFGPSLSSRPSRRKSPLTLAPGDVSPSLLRSSTSFGYVRPLFLYLLSVVWSWICSWSRVPWARTQFLI